MPVTYVDENEFFTTNKMDSIKGALMEVETEVGLLRDLIEANPNYPEQWKEHPAYRRARIAYLSLLNVSLEVFRRRTAEEPPA